MEIIINTGDELSDTDRSVLLALLVDPDTGEIPLPAGYTEDAPAPEPKPAKAKKAAKKAAAKPKPEPEPEEEEEPEAEEEAGGTPMEQAVALATSLVGDGKADIVKAALADLAVKRVSELDEDNVEAFLEAVRGD